MVLFQAGRWLRIGQAIFQGAGASEANAARVTEALVDACLAGHDSHGVLQIPPYVQAIEAGHLDPAGKPEVVKETACTSLVDGRWTFGQVGAAVCMRKAIEQAKESGIAISGLLHAHHVGRMGEYTEMACEAGMIGMAVAGGLFDNDRPRLGGQAPYGGAALTFGNNPISFGLPAGEQPPILADFATSSVAGGKIRMAAAKREQLPPNCILDREGRPSTSPADYYAGGMLLPFGAHKGYGLAFAVDLLCEALTGADDCDDERFRGSTYMRAGATFIAIDPGIFRAREAYVTAAERTIRRVKAVPPGVGFEEVLLPGDPERHSKARRQREGISLPESTWQEIRKIAARYGVQL